MFANAIRERLGAYQASAPRVYASGRLWPNGEFSLGYARDGEGDTEQAEWAWTKQESSISGDEMNARLEAMLELLDEVQGFYSVWGESRTVRLSLSNVLDSHRPTSRAKQGLKGMTSKGMKMVRSGAFLLEQRLGKEDCVMITLTVPTLCKADRVRVAKHWGTLTNRLVQWLSRALVKAGRAPVVIGCVEIQTRRLASSGEAYLHVHLICPAHSNTGGCWAIPAAALRSYWKAALERVINHTLPILPRVETAIVEKSVEGYLGKYLSKGTGEDLQSFIDDLGPECVPAQWWFASAPMKEAIKRGTSSGRNTGAILDALVQHLLEQGTGEGFEYIRHIDCVFDVLPVTVGYVGRLSPELRDEVFAMLSS